jgi:transcriptional regulator with XRE-family HTH domain
VDVDTAILRSARAARGLTQQAVARLTKLSPRMIAAIEDGRIDDLPGGFYARAYLRMYAHAVGIDDASVIQPMIDTIPKVEVELDTIVKCREPLDHRRSRLRIAVAADAAVVTAISVAGVLFCASLSGVARWHLRDACTAFLVLFGPTLILYFGVLGATGVGTAGARLFHIDFLPRAPGPIDGVEWLRRTVEYFHSEFVALLGGSPPPTGPPRAPEDPARV